MSFPNFTFWSQLLTTVGVEVCGVAALGFVAQCFFRSAVWKRAVWQMTVICLLLLPVSEWTGFGRGAAGFLFGHKPVVESAPVTGFTNFKSMPAGGSVAIKLKDSPAAAQPAVWWPAWVWLAGATLVLGRMAAAQVLLLALRLRREKIVTQSLRERVAFIARSIGLRRKISLLRMPGSISPMAFGILRTSIGLPPGFEAKLSVTEQEAVLAHELAHLAVMDPLWFLLADFASAWLWWHPLAWWVRRLLHGAAELAADEATTLVPDGPGALANCLVSLGKEMTAARGWSWVGINGGFRSNLGKRVERLMRMSGGVRRPLAGWAGATAKLAATILVVPTIVLLFGSFQSAQGQKEDRLRDQLRDSWNSSPGALLVLAALDDTEKQKEDIAKRVQNGKLLYEMGKYEEAEAVLVAVMKEDHANRPGAYYLDLIKEARLWGRSHKHEPVPLPTATTTQQRRDIDARVMKGKLLYERGKLDESEAVLVSVIKDDRANRAAAYYLDLIKEARFTGRAQNLQDVSEIMITTKGRQAILSKLNNIMLDNVSFDLPLKDVLLKLRTESQKRDPDGIGIKFMINQNVEGPEPFSTGTTGTVEAAPKAEQRDIGTDVRIKISSPLHNLRLADVLDAITKVADSPIRYTIKDDAVVFSPMLLEPNPGLALYSKTFRVDSGTFAQGLKRLYGTNLSLGGSSPSEGIEMDDGPDRPADGHDDFGGPVLPGARLSFVTRTNETIQLHQMLTQYFSAAGVNLDPPKAIFFNDGLGLLLVRATLPDLDIIEQAIDMLNQTPPQVTIEARFTEVDEAALQGLALNWNTPLQEITGLKTATGHRFWVATNSQDFTGTITAAQLRSTLTAIEQRFHADVLSVAKVTVESGRQAHLGSSNGAEAETLVVIPAIGPDGYFIQITASPAIMTGPETWQVKAIRKVLDGETMVIGSEITNHSPGPKKVWVVFITPRIMDPAGNPVHTDDELSKRIGTPRQ